MKLFGFTVEFSKADFSQSVSTAKAIGSVALEATIISAKAVASTYKEAYKVCKENNNLNNK